MSKPTSPPRRSDPGWSCLRPRMAARTRSVALALLLAGVSGPASAEQAQRLRTILTEEQALQRAETDAQAQVDALAEETEALLAEYRAVLDQTASLAVYNRQLGGMVAALEARLDGFDARLASAEETQRNVAPLLQRMLEVLERLIAADLPFLEEERSERLAGLRASLEDPAQPIGEKFRRMFEAYQVEMDYGRTIEAWRGTVDLGGGAQLMDLLRIGRLLLYGVSLDGNTALRWDPTEGTWVALPAQQLPQLQLALRVARKELPPELLILPVGAP